MNIIESVGLDSFAAIFFLIGMAIKDVLKEGNVPAFGRRIVWLVLFRLRRFYRKGIIQSVEGTEFQRFPNLINDNR
ncbi:DUF2788 domain-containing protein [Vibrio lentus]|nr:DUF2788 domain-containing protein [Vibrio lentus]